MSTVWESVEERERRIRGSRTTSAMSREATEAAEPKSLRDAFRYQRFVQAEDLRRLASQPYDRPVVSLYMNFAPEQPVRADRSVSLSVFHSLRHAALEASAEYLQSLPHEQRRSPENDLREMAQFLEGFEPAGARALVIFKSGEAVNRVVPLPVRVANHLTIEPDPYVEPLEAILEEQQRVLVLQVAKEETLVSIYQLGTEIPISRVVADIPRPNSDARRDDKEWRHRQTHIVWHFKSAAQLAQRVFGEAKCDLLVLIGEEVVVSEFEDYLSAALSTKVGGRLQLAPNAGPNERRAALERVLDEWRARDEQSTLEDLGLYRDRQRLAGGLQQVLDATNLFLTRQLFVRSDLSNSGYFCHRHHFLSLKPGQCPFDGQQLEPTAQLIDELVEMSRLHGVAVMLVSHHTEYLEPYGGIAALLVAPIPAGELRTVEVSS